MIRISKTDNVIVGNVKLPPSKSISNRYLLLHFYYDDSFRVFNLSGSDDTVLLSSTLDLIAQYKKRGDAGLLRIDARNAGSVIRFLVPLLSVTRGHFLLTGSDRMKHRPIGALVDAMRETGAEIDYLDRPGYPPLLIRGRPINTGRVRIDGSLSSQFVTALLLLAPTMDNGLTIDLTSKPYSWPYISMTTGILSRLGVQVVMQEDSIHVFRKKKISTDVTVESDWSAASFWYCMLSIAEKGEVFLDGLQRSGLQGDQQVSQIYSQFGVETLEETSGIRIRKTRQAQENVYIDLNDHPDLALPVLLSCAATGVNGTFTGLERLRIKESDRLEAVTSGLARVGILLREILPGTWQLSGELIKPCDIEIDDFSDHRVAMTFAGLALKGFTIRLEHPEVVNKSYPGFWNDLVGSGFALGE